MRRNRWSPSPEWAASIVNVPDCEVGPCDVKLEVLMNSIQRIGVYQPVVVRERPDGKFDLLAGFRRAKACMALGRKSIPAKIFRQEDGDIVEADFQIPENLLSDDPDPYDVAKWFLQRKQCDNLFDEDLAEEIGKSRPFVTHVIGLNETPEDLRALARVKAKRPSLGYFIEVAQFGDFDAVADFLRSKNDGSVRRCDIRGAKPNQAPRKGAAIRAAKRATKTASALKQQIATAATGESDKVGPLLARIAKVLRDAQECLAEFNRKHVNVSAMSHHEHEGGSASDAGGAP